MKYLLDVGFCLDVRRLLTRRASANLKNLFFENLLQPIFVALIVLFSFVNRCDVFAHREALVYFSGLYAFWVGMFGSCQSINMELRNGEWSYWILGMRRNRYIHLLAIGFVNFVFAVTQLAVFCGTIFCFRLLSDLPWGGIGDIYGHFIDAFLSFSSDDGSSLFQMQGMLRCLLESYCPGWGVDVFVFLLFGAALLVASVSGIGFGLLFSASFKDPIVSLNISVGFVVVLGMLSYVGLKGTSHSDDLRILKSDFALTILAQNRICCDGKLKHDKNLYVLLKLSKLLPQRYFYNIGTLTFRHDLNRWSDEAGNEHNDYEALIDRFHPKDIKAFWLREARLGESRSLLAEDSRCSLLEVRDPAIEKDLLNIEALGPDWPMNMIDIFTKARMTDADYCSRMEFPFAFAVMIRAVLFEIARVFVIFIFCVLLTMMQLHRREVFHVLR